MKKLAALVLALFTVVTVAPVFAGGNKESGGNKVVLTMGSWRADDVEQMNNLLAEYKKIAPNVEIQFKPTNPSDYNATLRLQLDSGTGPDLMYARSYATGQELYEAGFFADCTNIPGLLTNFSETNRAPWMSKDGKMFAVPFAAVSHAVYYNKDVFKKEGLSIPTTWEDFLKLCDTLQKKGYTPLANGVADEWDILECFFLGGIVPDFVGGAPERIKYEKGEKKLNDASFVSAYKAMADVAKYCPKGYESVTYNDSQVLFNTQKAVMFQDGSWTAGVYKDAPFNWGVFAMPAPAGRKTVICFHPDMALTMNTKTAHPAEAQAFLAWLCTKDGATTASKNLPVGYFPMIKFDIKLQDPHANEFLALNAGKETDARFVWPALMDLYSPMNQAVIGAMKGTLTPQQAADMVASQKKQ
jgi:raffinose/stachyose/melibiose transport system substrate-binding protein